MKHFRTGFWLSLMIGLGLVVALLCALDSGPAVHAAGILYVSATDPTCAGNAPCYTVIQDAVDAAIADDEIWVATGAYTGVHARGSVTQVVYVSETVTIRGGYSSDFLTWDPDTYASTIDAEQDGRVVYIAGDYTPTLEALRLTGGSSSGSSSDRGGGIYATSAHPVISGCHIYNNTADRGAGIYIDSGERAMLIDNTIYDNPAAGSGGGISLYDCANATLDGNEVYSNTAGSGGAGMRISSSDGVALYGNRVHDNRSAGGSGGGIRLSDSNTATLTSNHVYSNATGQTGGGLLVLTSLDVTLTDNHVYSNTAGTEGGGLYVSASTRAAVTDNKVYSNTAALFGGGIRIHGSFTSTLTGNEVYSNTASAGGGIHLQISSDSTLSDNEFHSNTADSGGGIYLTNSSNITLTDNQVCSNTVSAFGGGMLVHGVTSTVIIQNEVYSNTADAGGGIRLSYCDSATVEDNHIYRNAAHVSGGGIGVSESDRATLSGNDVHHNTTNSGAGIYVVHSPTATLSVNEVYSNTASISGGGIELGTSPGTALTSNRIHHNTAAEGGGVRLMANDDTTLTGNWVTGNTTIDYSGSGFYIRDSVGIELVNNVVVENHLVGTGYAPGIFVGRSDVHLLHNTLARNTGGDGSGIYVGGWLGVHGAVWLTNTILVSHTAGISVATGSIATLEATLWGNGQDWTGNGLILTGTVNVWGDPGFIDPDGGDYHIGSRSAGLDLGIETGVNDDVDGDSRPYGSASELGADEIQCYVRMGSTYYASVQAAIDASASSNDVIQVAGTCQGVIERDASCQVAYISKTLTVRGGYSLDFGSWDPQVYPTTLNAEGLGRVVRIVGDVSPAIDSLHIVRGDASGGGGIFSNQSHPIITGCHIYSNTAATEGGGIELYDSSNARLANNRIYHNASGTFGGGIALVNSDGSDVTGNQVYSNTTISNMPIGGGAYIIDSDAISLTGNLFYDNLVQGRMAAFGGGLTIWNSDNATLANNVIAHNRLDGTGTGAGIYLRDSADVRMLHATIADNSGGSGQGVYVHGSGYTAYLTNTILISHAVGVETAMGAGVSLNATLWGNVIETVGSGIVTGSLNWWDNPAFADPDTGDYHLGTGSAAFERGVVTWVHDDIDGDIRSMGLGMQPDLGADEALPILAVTKTGPAWYNPGTDIVYTLHITNTGVVTARMVLLFDTLPDGATFVGASHAGDNKGGMINWPSFSLGPNGTGTTRVFTVTAADTIVNDAYRVSSVGTPIVSGTIAITSSRNHAPGADAGSPQTRHAGTIDLDGTGSGDPDGHALSYAWVQTGGPVSVVVGNADAETATFDAPLVVGIYEFALTVTDTYGLSDSDTTSVTIANQPPAADAGLPQTAALGAAVTLNGSGSSDPDGDALAYSWAQSGGISVTLSSSTAISPTFAAPTSTGVLTFTLTITDAFGLVGTDTTTVAVEQHRVYLPLVIRSYP